MAWLILTIVLFIVAAGALFFALPPYRLIVPAVAIGVWLILTVFMSIHTVGQREVGLVQSFSGAISNNYKTTGVVWTAPWNHIKKEDIGLLKETFHFVGSNSAVSKDQQAIDAEVTLNFRVDPKDVVAIWKSVGPAWRQVLLDGRVPQDFKETTAKFTAPEITLRRPALRKETLSRLKRELCPRRNGQLVEGFCINAEDVFISNVGYSPEYNQAINAKVVQQQAALTAEAKVKQAEAEANQSVATAEGEKRAAIAKAEGDARAIELQGKALRNNPEVIRFQAIQKLAAQAQVIFCTTNNCPSILGSLSGAGR